MSLLDAIEIVETETMPPGVIAIRSMWTEANPETESIELHVQQVMVRVGASVSPQYRQEGQ